MSRIRGEEGGWELELCSMALAQDFGDELTPSNKNAVGYPTVCRRLVRVPQARLSIHVNVEGNGQDPDLNRWACMKARLTDVPDGKTRQLHEHPEIDVD